MSMPSSNMPTCDQTHSFADVAAAIHQGKRFFLLTHVRPDGDAIGSLGGMGKSLRKAGKHVDIGLADPVPARFAFLLENETLWRPDQLEADQYDVLIALDAGDKERTGFSLTNGTGTALVNIDHHPTNTRFGDVNLIDAQASSTCEMICELIRRAGLPLDAEVAESLYLGLLTDSRFFQNENLRPSAHHVAAALLETGLDSRRVLSALTSSRALPELRLLGRGFAKAKVDCEGALISVVLTKRDLTACGATWNHAFSCGLFNQLTSVEGVVASVAVVEGDEGQAFCEFRSRGGFSVKDVAVSMGGGGHLAASGCNRISPVRLVAREAIRRTRDNLRQFLARP